MKLEAHEQIKSLLAQRKMTLKRLAELLSEKTGKKHTSDNLSHKLRRGTISYNLMLVIAEILDYDIEFVSKK
ncbi:LLM class flavin-dependent oxidoreductase [bacterium]|nr:LLM class flavin-dependent oxidoreductase [bacterium]